MEAGVAMNLLYPVHTLRWTWQDYTECGLMLVAPDGSPRWLPLIPLETDPWGDGMVRPDPAHLVQLRESEWAIVAYPKWPWVLPARDWVPNGPRGRIVRSFN